MRFGWLTHKIRLCVGLFVTADNENDTSSVSKSAILSTRSGYVSVCLSQLITDENDTSSVSKSSILSIRSGYVSVCLAQLITDESDTSSVYSTYSSVNKISSSRRSWYCPFLAPSIHDLWYKRIT